MARATRRTLEQVTAGAVMLFGGAVGANSLSHDIGWNANGPGPGYFPFRVGLLLVVAGAILGVQARRTARDRLFATGDELRRSLMVFWPTAAVVAGMFPLGCYVPSLAYLAWMMRAHGGYGWPKAIVAAAASVAVLFVVFEIWFMVPLAKGPVEASLGLY